MSNGTSSSKPFWTVAILIAFAFAILIAVLLKLPVVDRLSDQVFARGLITFIITISTIGIAFILVYQAFFSFEPSDERFRRGREIFTGLMGVLGTIVGFYFGAAEKPVTTFEIADIKVVESRLVTHIIGGARPYVYTASFSEKELEPIKNQVSEDGWIIQPLPAAIKSGTITLDVSDSKEQKVSKKYKFSIEKAEAAVKSGVTVTEQGKPAAPSTKTPLGQKKPAAQK